MKNSKKEYITLLSVVSAISVVILHTNGCFWNFSKSRYWLTANIIESLFYFAVPIFFMITGATLIDYQEKYSTKEYFKKRIKKTFIPFIIWSLIGVLYLIQKGTISTNIITLKYLFNGIFNTSFITIYWFFIPLFCIYLCIPLFASIDKQKKISTFKYISILFFFFNILLPFINSVFKLELSLPISIMVCSNYLFYVVIGYILDNIDIKKTYRYIIYLISLTGLLMHIIGTHKLSYTANMIDRTYKGYLNLPCVIYSIGIFVLFKEISKHLKNNKIINILSKYTFAIYLLHWFLIDLSIRLFKVNTLSIFYRLGAPLIIIPICIIIAWVLRKIPFVKHIIP